MFKKKKDIGSPNGLKTKQNKKQDTTICFLHFSFKDTHRLKVKKWEKIFHANRNQKKARIAILTSDKMDFKPNYNK